MTCQATQKCTKVKDIVPKRILGYKGTMKGPIIWGDGSKIDMAGQLQDHTKTVSYWRKKASTDMNENSETSKNLQLLKGNHVNYPLKSLEGYVLYVSDYHHIVGVLAINCLVRPEWIGMDEREKLNLFL